MNASPSAAKLDADELFNLLGATQTADFAERRSEARHPFFAPVSIRYVNHPTQLLSAFSREISHGGIGLLHNAALEQGSVAEVTITAGATKTTKSAEVVWCKPAGEGWYLSGWRFLAAGQ